MWSIAKLISSPNIPTDLDSSVPNPTTRISHRCRSSAYLIAGPYVHTTSLFRLRLSILASHMSQCRGCSFSLPFTSTHNFVLPLYLPLFSNATQQNLFNKTPFGPFLSHSSISCSTSSSSYSSFVLSFNSLCNSTLFKRDF